VIFFLPTNAAERVYKGGGAGWWVDGLGSCCSSSMAWFVVMFN